MDRQQMDPRKEISVKNFRLVKLLKIVAMQTIITPKAHVISAHFSENFEPPIQFVRQNAGEEAKSSPIASLTMASYSLSVSLGMSV